MHGQRRANSSISLPFGLSRHPHLGVCFSQILQAKIRRLEHLLHLKDVRVDDLAEKLDQTRGVPGGNAGGPSRQPKMQMPMNGRKWTFSVLGTCAGRCYWSMIILTLCFGLVSFSLPTFDSILYKECKIRVNNKLSDSETFWSHPLELQKFDFHSLPGGGRGVGAAIRFYLRSRDACSGKTKTERERISRCCSLSLSVFLSIMSRRFRSITTLFTWREKESAKKREKSARARAVVATNNKRKRKRRREREWGKKVEVRQTDKEKKTKIKSENRKGDAHRTDREEWKIFDKIASLITVYSLKRLFWMNACYYDDF